MTNAATLAQQALAESKLRVDKLTPSQHQEILAALESKFASANASTSASDDTELFSINIGCIGCETGLNVVAAVPIGVIISAGVAVGPEAVAVVAIAEFFGVGAASVATVINTVLAAAGGTSVEGVIAALCQNFGAC